MIDYLKTIPLTISISLLAILAFAFPQFLIGLEYGTHVSPIDQIVSLFGCHLLHWSSEHLFWDLGMFALLGAICERISRRTFAVVLVLSAVFIPPLVGIYEPAVETYRGLSGLDTAIFGMAVVHFLIEKLRERDKTGSFINLGLLIGMVGKIVHEMISGSTIFVESTGFSPVPIAHVVGAIIGILAGIWIGFQLGTKRIDPAPFLEPKQPSHTPTANSNWV